MFDLLKKIFSEGDKSTAAQFVAEDDSEKKKLQIATCAIFIEIARSDENYTEEERNEIISIMQRTFNLEKEYANELIELAKLRLDQSVSLYEFTEVINEYFSNEEKFELMKNLWRLIYSDQTLDKYEDRLIKLLGTMLHLEHQDIIAAKLIVKEEIAK